MEPLNAVVTGSSRGIGVYIASALAGRGMNLLLVARTEPLLTAFGEELRVCYPHLHVATAVIDLGEPDSARQVIAAAEREMGHVDVLVNNAALDPYARFHSLCYENIEYLMQVNLTTPMLLSRLVLPGMVERRFGRIVNMTSLGGGAGLPNAEAIAAAKGGLAAFSRALHHDYRGRGVTSTSVLVGAVKSAGAPARAAVEAGVRPRDAWMSSPEKVAGATLRAIDKGKAEIVVAPGSGRIARKVVDRASRAEEIRTSAAALREARRIRMVRSAGRGHGSA